MQRVRDASDTTSIPFAILRLTLSINALLASEISQLNVFCAALSNRIRQTGPDSPDFISCKARKGRISNTVSPYNARCRSNFECLQCVLQRDFVGIFKLKLLASALFESLRVQFHSLIRRRVTSHQLDDDGSARWFSYALLRLWIIHWRRMEDVHADKYTWHGNRARDGDPPGENNKR